CSMLSNDPSQADSSRVITSGPIVMSFCSTCSKTSESGSSNSLISESSSFSFIKTNLRKRKLMITAQILIAVIFAPMYKLRFHFEYVRHFLMSHSRHGTHSPFVYRLVDEVIYAAVSEG